MDHEETRLELIQEGILDLYDQENPRAIQAKLEALAAGILETNPKAGPHQLMPSAPRRRESSVIS